jgi:hypothetical protein
MNSWVRGGELVPAGWAGVAELAPEVFAATEGIERELGGLVPVSSRRTSTGDPVHAWEEGDPSEAGDRRWGRRRVGLRRRRQPEVTASWKQVWKCCTTGSLRPKTM